MGTSSSSGGPKGNSPSLLPPYAPEPPALPPISPPPPTDEQNQQTPNDNPDQAPLLPNAPERPTNDQVPSDLLQAPTRIVPQTSWSSPKTAMSRFASGGGGDSRKIRNATRQYVKARGGARGAALSSRAGQAATTRLASFISRGAESGFQNVAQSFSISNISSRNVDAVLADFIDALAPIGATVDESVARCAVISTLTEIFEKLEVQSKGIEVLNALNEQDIKDVIEASIVNYIDEKFQRDLISRIERNAVNAGVAEQLSREVKEYIRATIRLDMHNLDISQFDWESHEGKQKINEYYEKAFFLLGE